MDTLANISQFGIINKTLSFKDCGSHIDMFITITKNFKIVYNLLLVVKGNNIYYNI